MLKRLSIAAALLVLLATAGVMLALRGRTRPRPAAAAVVDEVELPPTPEISLQVDTSDELTAVQGTPFVLSVALINHRAMNAALENEARHRTLLRVGADVAAGRISAADAEAVLAENRRSRPIPIVRLGAAGGGWTDFVRFEVNRTDGAGAQSQWAVTLLTRAAAEELVLDASTTARLDFGVAPDASSRIPPGDYRVVAALAAPAQARVPPDHWTGHVPSSAVRVSILPRSDRLSPEQERTSAMQSARYFSVAKDWPRALEQARKVLAGEPGSIEAHVIAGDADVALSKTDDAAKAYQEALRLFHERYPKAYEQPVYVIDRLVALQRARNGGRGRGR